MTDNKVDPPVSDSKTDLRLTTLTLSGSKDFLEWSHAIERALKSRGLHHHLAMTPPPTTDAQFSSWSQNDNRVCTWLTNSMESSYYRAIMYLSTAKEMWYQLKSLYSSEDNLQRLYDIFSEFSTSTPGEDLHAFGAKFRGLLEEWNLYQPISTDPAVTKSQREALVGTFYLAKMKSYLDGVRSFLLSQGGTPTLNSILAATYRVLPVGAPAVEASSSALFSQGRGRGSTSGRGRPPTSTRGRGGRGRARGKGSLSCSHCGRTNHSEQFCWEKHGYPDQTPTAQQTSTPASSETPQPTTSSSQISAEDLQHLQRIFSHISTAKLSTSGQPDEGADWWG